jgi:hypothetical protein
MTSVALHPETSELGAAEPVAAKVKQKKDGGPSGKRSL